MEYILAAHIRITGGPEAAAQIQAINTQLGNLGKGTGGEQAGQQVAKGLDSARQSASFLDKAIRQAETALIRFTTYQGIRLVEDGIRQAVGAWLDFDAAMTNSLSIQQGVTGGMRTQMEDLAKSISVKLGEAPKEVAEGFYFLASAGLGFNEQMKDLPYVAEFAKAGLMSIDGATEILLDSLAALGLKSRDPVLQFENLRNLGDLITQAAIDSQGTIEQFGESLTHKGAAAIKGFNIPLQEGIGLLEVFAERGLKGASAGERLSMLLRDMAIKSTTHAEAWERLNVQIYDAEGNFRSMKDILPELDRALAPLSAEERIKALRDMGFTMRDMNTVMGLIGTSDSFLRFERQLEDAGGAAERVAKNQMESLRAKLDQLKSWAMVMSIEGLDKLQDAANWLIAVFSPAASATRDLLQAMGEKAKPFIDFLGFVAVSGAAAILQGISTAIQAIFDTITAHPMLVEGLVAALLAIGAAQIASGILGLVTGPLETLYLKLLYAKDGVSNFIANLGSLAGQDRIIDGISGAFHRLMEFLTSPVVLTAGVIFAIMQIKNGLDEGKKKAQEFTQALEKRVDITTMQGLAEAVNETAKRYGELIQKQQENDGWWHKIKSGIDLLDGPLHTEKDNFMKLGAEIDAVGAKNKEYKEALDNLRGGFESIENALAGKKLFDPNFMGPVDDFTAKMRDMADKAGLTGMSVDGLRGYLVDLAKQAGIKTDAPFQDWAPNLMDLYIRMREARDITKDIGGVAEGSATQMSPMGDAIMTLKDKAADAESKLKALKTVLDGLSGGKQNLFDMQTNFAAAMDALVNSFKEVGPTFDIFNEKGRAQRQALSDAASAARDLALAQGEASGNMQTGAKFLQDYASGLEQTLINAGLTTDQVHALLLQMGLTPEQIATLFKITADPTVDKMNKDLDNVAREREQITKTLLPFKDQADADLTHLARDRDSLIKSIVSPGSSETDMNFLARNRDAIIAAFAHPGTSEADLNWLSRLRDALLQARVAGSAQAEAILNEIGKDRTVTYYAQVVAQTGGPNLAAAAEGGILNAQGVHTFARGGFENHQAMIAMGGPTRIWAEPETGGEAYIPMARAKRDRSMAIWEEVGRRFGVMDGKGFGPTSKLSVLHLSSPIQVSIDASGMNAEEIGPLVATSIQDSMNMFAAHLLTELRAN